LAVPIPVTAPLHPVTDLTTVPGVALTVKVSVDP